MRIKALLLFFFLALPVVADDAALWAALQTQPNMVVLMRHAHATGGNPLTWDESGGCRGERTLTEKGKVLAARIGEAFASRGIKPNAVISSPMCRCRLTAEIAFGPSYLTDPILREIASANAEQQKAFETKARELIGRNRGKPPVIFVSHTPNIDALTFELIDEEDLLVGKTSESGEIEVLGKIRMEP
jgi:phosphohistidine phosphatase SixA